MRTLKEMQMLTNNKSDKYTRLMLEEIKGIKRLKKSQAGQVII